MHKFEYFKALLRQFEKTRCKGSNFDYLRQLQKRLAPNHHF